MTYSEQGFRAVYHKYCVLILNDDIRYLIKGFEGADEANVVLAYGFDMSQNGMMLEILAAGLRTEEELKFFEPQMALRSTVRVADIGDVDIETIPNVEEEFEKKYEKKLAVLGQYDPSDEIEKTREMEFLDDSRDDRFIDHVEVILKRDGDVPERCMIRIEGIGDHCFIGTLLEEPKTDYGYHKGDQLAFNVEEDADGYVICTANMNPTRKLTIEDFRDGSLLKNAVTKFNLDRTDARMMDIFQVLRDAVVWIPCNAITTDEDQEKMDKLLKAVGGDKENLPERNLGKDGAVRLVPDIMKSGKYYFFPVFSSPAEMGRYSDRFEKVEKTMIEAMEMARNNYREVAGIVINAFTGPVVIETRFFDMIAGLESKIK